MIDEEASTLEDDPPSARTESPTSQFAGLPASLSAASRADFTLGSAV